MRTTTAITPPLSAPASTGGRSLASVLFELPWTAFETLCRWQARVESRRQLAELDDRMLADIGVTADEARAEAAKPFWKS